MEKFCLLMRRLLRFRLLTLFLLILIAALASGWRLKRRSQVTRQHEAIAHIARLQARLTQPPETWIEQPLVAESKQVPWWLASSELRNAHIAKQVSFDLRSHDDGFELPTDFSNKDLEWISRLPALQSLRLPRSQVDDDGLQRLRRLKRLRILDLSHTAITDDGLRQLSELESLETLILDGAQINGSGLLHLAGCERLREISLGGVALHQAEHLNDIKTLESIVITSGTLQRCDLRSLPGLRKLSVSLDAAGAAVYLERLPNLRDVDIGIGSQERSGSIVLKDLPSLTAVEFQVNADMGSARDRLELQHLPALQRVTIYAHALAGQFAHQVASLHSVRELTLAGASSTLNDTTLQPITGLTRLQKLFLPETEITDRGLADLAGMESLVELALASDRMTEEGVRSLSTLPVLKSLSLSGVVSDEDLGATLKLFRHVRSIGLGRCQAPSITLMPNGQDAVSMLPQLQRLTISADSPRQIRIAELQSLVELSLDAAGASEIAVYRLPRLKRLNISLVKEQEVQSFNLRELPELSWLSLQCGATGARVPADTFQHFRDFKSLRSGIIYGLEMPDAARKDLKEFEKATGKRF